MALMFYSIPHIHHTFGTDTDEENINVTEIYAHRFDISGSTYTVCLISVFFYENAT